jgi:membrane-associated protein
VFDLVTLLPTIGYLGMFAIILIETGLLVGFFLPGDSLLLMAGTLAASGTLNLPLSMLACALGSIVGDQIAYFIGKSAGPKVFNRQESRFFHPENVDKAKAFFDRYGVFAIIIARFIPVVRAFVPTMAGVTKLPYRMFLPLSIFGGALWGVSLVALGFFLGKLIPDLEKYIYLVIIAGMLAGLIPALWKIFGPKKAVANKQ